MVVEKQTQAQQPGRTQSLVVGQNEAQRADEMRRDRPEHLTLHECLTNEAKFVVLQIAQAAMDELC